MRNCLVTGGAGFIGSHIVQALLDAGDRVRVLDDFSTGKRENLADLNGDFELIEGDLCDPTAIRQAIAGIDVIFHQAAIVSVPGSMEDPGSCFETNVAGTARMLEAARQAGVRKVVQASSCAVYGDNQSLPLDEHEEPDPQSPYATSKLTNEYYGELYARQLGLPVVSLRYFNVYGPRQSAASDYAAVIPIFIRRLLRGVPAVVYGDGGQTRDFIFVRDVVRANLAAAHNQKGEGSVINVCTGLETSILDLIHTISKLLGIPINKEHQSPRPGDIYRSVGNPGRSAKIIDFQTETSLSEGLRLTLEWARSEIDRETPV